MGRDYSRFTHNPQKHYSGVLMQQGRVQLDADWNEAQEIGDRRWRAETLDLMGQAAVPESTPDAFRLQSDGAGSLTLGIGRMYVDGLLAENHGLPPQQYNAQLGERYGTLPTPYAQQPYCPQPPALSTTPGLTDLLYLDLWQREVSTLEDPDIQEIALGGPDTATRIQTLWQVKALPNIGALTCGADLSRWDDLIKPSAGRLTTAAIAPPTNTDPCIISPKIGYRGLENRLYRLEVHVGGGLGTAKFKWSRDNGAVASGVEGIASGRDRLTVRLIGRDALLRFKVGDWVEVVDDVVEFSDNPSGHLAKVIDIEEPNRVLVIDPPIPASFDFPTHPTSNATDPVRHTRVRRWDQKAPDGLLTVGPGPIDLEDGIQVSFSVDGAIGTNFKVGDAWVFAARAADASVEVLTQAPPRSLLHHYARLALVTQTDAQPLITDCRTLYPPTRCCLVVRPGEDIQAAIHKLCQTGGCLCLAPGIHRIRKPLMIDGCKNLTIQGVGNASRLVFDPATLPTTADPGMALIYIVGGSQQIRLENLLGYAEGLVALVVVDEDSEVITLNQVTFINGNFQAQNRLQPACVVLGNCCQVAMTDSTLLGGTGLLQTPPELLQALRDRLQQIRDPQIRPSPNDAPPRLKPLIGFHCDDNSLYVLSTGVSLEDAIEGTICRNRLQGLPTDFEGPTSTADQGDRMASVLVPWLDQTLAWLACPPTPQVPPEVRDIGLFACLLEKFAITDNQIQALRGIFLSFARGVNLVGNRITAVQTKVLQEETTDQAFIPQRRGDAAIALAFGFDLLVQGNRIHSNIAPVRERFQRTTLAEDYLNDRANTGYLGIALGSARGITLRDNQIHATSGIATVRWLRGFTQVRRAAEYPDALLRVLGLRRAWRVFQELAWVIWQFIQIARQSSTNAGGSAANPLTRPQFAQLLVKGFVKGLTTPDLLPNFVGKATIAHNEIQVSRVGLCFPSLFTVGGLQIQDNRISGFTATGILLHPWLSLSFPDLTAQLLYCGLEWILGVLTLLRDALAAMLEGNPPAATPGAGTWSPAEIGVALVSWTVSFCARYCAGEPTSDGEGTPENPPPRSPSEDLKEAIDDLLENLDLTWLDDLVNQSYRIDSNTLRGSGDGIWNGIDGSQVSHNQVTIHPTNPAPFETMALGIIMHLGQVSDNLALLPLFLVEMDRDLILYAALLLELLDASTLNLPASELQATMDDFLPILSATSPLRSPALALRDALQAANPPAADIVKAMLVDLLAAIAQHTRGYGIALMGADITCLHNQVYGTIHCGAEALTNRAMFNGFGTDRSPPPVVRYPAIAGIWHFSNVLNLSFEILALARSPREMANVQVQSRLERSVKPITLVIAAFLLLARKDRRIHLQSNVVETALAYGIRTLDVTGLEEVSILDNEVTNAVRYAIAHQSLIGQDQKCYIKVHRNTVTRTNSVFDLFGAISSLNPKHV